MMRMNKVLVAFVLVSFMFSATGCALILNGKKQEVDISADPSDQVQAKINGKKIKVPKTISLVRDKSYTITATRPGCEPVKEKIEPRFGTAGAWVDLVAILGFGIGLIWLPIDYFTGAAFKLEPDEVTLAFNCAGSGAQSDDEEPPAKSKKSKKRKAAEEEEEEDF